MTPKQQQTLEQLRDAGYVVVVWTPEELRGADPIRVGDYCIELCSDIIDCLAFEEDSE